MNEPDWNPNQIHCTLLALVPLAASRDVLYYIKWQVYLFPINYTALASEETSPMAIPWSSGNSLHVCVSLSLSCITAELADAFFGSLA